MSDDGLRESADARALNHKSDSWIQRGERYDEGGSHGGSMERPALKRHLAKIEACETDHLVVYQVDRVIRSPGNLENSHGILRFRA